MKKTTIQFASRWAVLALAVFTIIGFTSCSKDDDNSRSNQKELWGTWKREYVIDMYNNGVEEITFVRDGNGYITNTSGNHANFTYEVKGQYIYFNITWWYKGGGYMADNYYWQYWINGDTLSLGDKMYKKKTDSWTY
jgi:hypothetical protein